MTTKKNILVVDDEENIRFLYKEVLSDEGYEVTLASSAEEALEKIKIKIPDLITLDVKMNGMDGMEMVKKLSDENNNIPVIICSAYGSYKQDFNLWASSAYVVKSADMSELKLTIKEILAF
ncbi:MAG: response regulator [Nitrospinales bacterium]